MPKAARPGEWAEKIRELMDAAQLSQTALAERIESELQGAVSQGTVSSWLRGDERYTPSAKMLAQLGNVAVEFGLDPSWFWERAGFDRKSLMAFASKLLRSKKVDEGEVVAISPASGIGGLPKTRARGELAISAALIPNPLSTSYILAKDVRAETVFDPLDRLVIDTSASDLQSLFGKFVLVEFESESQRPERDHWTMQPGRNWPSGGSLFGRLWLANHLPTWNFSVDIRPIRSEAEPIALAWYTVPHKTSEERVRGAQQIREAHEKAASSIRLPDSCRIVGRMVAWISSSGAQSE